MRDEPWGVQGVNEATPFLSFLLLSPRVSLIQAAMAMHRAPRENTVSTEISGLDSSPWTCHLNQTWPCISILYIHLCIDVEMIKQGSPKVAPSHTLFDHISDYKMTVHLRSSQWYTESPGDSIIRIRCSVQDSMLNVLIQVSYSNRAVVRPSFYIKSTRDTQSYHSCFCVQEDSLDSLKMRCEMASQTKQCGQRKREDEQEPRLMSKCARSFPFPIRLILFIFLSELQRSSMHRRLVK